MRLSLRSTAILALYALLLLLSASAASADKLRIDTNNWIDDDVPINGFLDASVQPGTSAIWSRTDGSLANTCTASAMSIKVEFQGGASAGGKVSTLSFTGCTRPVTVHLKGTFFVTQIGSTRNGTVTSSGAEVTVSTPFGTVNCKTGEGVDLGVLTGAPPEINGHARLLVNATLNCGFLLPSATLSGTYEFSSPTGLYVE